ncbi:DMT family transporter [Halorussus halobius]|uniref:DMT family transporter n=1 Tax=Halorussus halobius TaxID=1710537 RepID=UPI0010922EA2|nr:DMT family transporter [Halorussus halobius]
MWNPNLRSHADIGLFVGLAAVWGTAYLAIEVGLATAPPVTFAALRYDVAGLVLLAVAGVLAVRRGNRLLPRTRDEWTLVGVGGLLVIGVHFALLFAGQRYVSGGVASVVMSLTPVLTPLFALGLLPDERPDARQAVGVVLGLVGVGIVARPDPSGGATAVGVGLLVLSAASFALGSVLTRRYESGLSVVAAQAWTMLVGAVVLDLLVVGLPGESFGRVVATPALVGALAYLSVVASVGGFVAYFRLLDRFGPNEATLVSYAVPMFAALSEWLVLGETVTATTVAGFAVIACGFAAIKWRALRRATTPSPDRSAARSQASTAGAVMVRGNVYLRDAE